MPGSPAPPADVWWFCAPDIVLGPADLAALSAEEKARAASFAFPADRHRYQVAHVMLRRVLAGKLGAEPGELAFGREPCPRCGKPSGRPVLASGGRPGAAPGGRPGAASRGEPCFSLAHSGDMIVIAVAGHRVGVDLERQTARCLCFLTDTMHPHDAAAVAALAEPDRHEVILRWWVRAEATLKCAGAGIAHGMGGTALLSPDSAAGQSGAAGQSVTDLAAPEGYRAALAVAAAAGARGDSR
jgi:4'-phosphopantetheinyl transferase